MKQFNISNLFKTRPGFSKESFFAVNTCLLIFLFSIPSSSFAADSCRWVATANRPIASIVRDVTEKSGKAPVKSCGAGADFKVCHSCEDRLTEKQWRKIQLMLAEPSYRKWHQSWHSKSFTEAMKRAQESNGTLKANEIQGENFFYAHREMIRNVQANLAAEGLPCITPWTELPKDADDPIWPNTKALMFRKLKEKCDSLGEENILKIDTFNTELRIKRKEINDSRDTKERELDSIKDRTELFNRQEELWLESEEAVKKVKSELLLKHGLTDETVHLARDCPTKSSIQSINDKQKYLFDSTVEHSSSRFLSGTLGNLGHAIEGGWHGTIHGTYNTEQPNYCSSQNNAPECDDMGSAYSSHVNIHFYKAHGLVDEYIEKWLKANNYEIANTSCSSKDKKCYKWKGTYTGEMPDFVLGTGCKLEHPQQSGVTGIETKSSEPTSAVQ